MSTHNQAASTIRAGVLDLFWDPSKLAFYDFNLTSNARNSIFTAATFYPLWNGIVPDEVLSSSNNAFGFFSAVHMVLNRYNGTFPVTFLESGLQWYVRSFLTIAISLTAYIYAGTHRTLGPLTNTSFSKPSAHCRPTCLADQPPHRPAANLLLILSLQVRLASQRISSRASLSWGPEMRPSQVRTLISIR